MCLSRPGSRMPLSKTTSYLDEKQMRAGTRKCWRPVLFYQTWRSYQEETWQRLERRSTCLQSLIWFSFGIGCMMESCDHSLRDVNKTGLEALPVSVFWQNATNKAFRTGSKLKSIFRIWLCEIVKSEGAARAMLFISCKCLYKIHSISSFLMWDFLLVARTGDAYKIYLKFLLCFTLLIYVLHCIIWLWYMLNVMFREWICLEVRSSVWVWLEPCTAAVPFTCWMIRSLQWTLTWGNTSLRRSSALRGCYRVG